MIKNDERTILITGALGPLANITIGIIRVVWGIRGGVGGPVVITWFYDHSSFLSPYSPWIHLESNL